MCKTLSFVFSSKYVSHIPKAAFPCMRIIYPTDFSRTDEKPYRKKCFPDAAIYTFFFAFSRGENRITRAENRMRGANLYM